MQSCDEISGRGKQRRDGGGNLAGVIRCSRVRLKLSLAIIEQSGVAAELQSAVRHLQLRREIHLAFEPRLDDQRPAFLERAGHPASMRLDQLWLPETDGVAPGDPERFLHHDLMLTACANRRDDFERVIQFRHRDAHFILSAKPRLWFYGAEELAKKSRAPRLRVELSERGVEALRCGTVFLVETAHQWRQQFQAVRPPGPRTEPSEFPPGEFGDGGVRFGPRFDKLRQRKARLLDAAEKFHGRPLPDQHDVILPAKKLGKSRQVAGELRLMLRGREAVALRDEAFRKRIEDEHARRAPFRLREDIQLRDELRVKARRAPALGVEQKSLRPLRRERKLELAAEGIPVALVRILPAPEPLQPVGDVRDLVAINLLQQRGAFRVADARKARRELAREVEVRLLEGEAQSGDVIHRVLHPGNRAPEVTADRQFTELDAARAHPRDVEPRVFLLVLQRLEHAASEGGGRIGKPQEHERHEFGGEQFVVREEVEQPPALAFLFQRVEPGELALRGVLRLELQSGRPARHGRRADRRARTFVADRIRTPELFLQRRGKQDLFGKLAQFHRADERLPTSGWTGENGVRRSVSNERNWFWNRRPLSWPHPSPRPSPR